MPEKTSDIPFFEMQRIVGQAANVGERHPDYLANQSDWDVVRDSMRSQSWIKDRGEKYLPRPAGMTGEYASAYDAYIERAHYPQISPYVLSGALGIVINKLPDYSVPDSMEYIIEKATKDGDTLNKLFIDSLTEVLQTGKCPILLDMLPHINEFRFVRYKAESFVNWKERMEGEDKRLVLAVFLESAPNTVDIFSHDYVDIYRVLVIENGVYTSIVYDDSGNEIPGMRKIPSYYGTPYREIPLFIAGSVSTNTNSQPIPLLPVANCAIDIYRKEADLANSEFLSCNPTLCIAGASNDDELPNVVGSSVMIVLPDPQSRVFYTETDTAALQHVKEHIADLYEEAIRHGVAILDTRKGVESAEALRIRQATQAASIYSMYLSTATAILNGLKTIAAWIGEDPDKIKMDIPTSLTHGVPDASIIREVVSGFGSSTIPLNVVHRYMISSGLIDASVSYEEYVKDLATDKKLLEVLGVTQQPNTPNNNGSSNNDPDTTTNKEE